MFISKVNRTEHPHLKEILWELRCLRNCHNDLEPSAGRKARHAYPISDRALLAFVLSAVLMHSRLKEEGKVGQHLHGVPIDDPSLRIYQDLELDGVPDGAKPANPSM